MSDRGIDPDYAEIPDRRTRESFERIICKMLELRRVDNSSHEEKSWKDWALGIMSVLITVGIPAVIYQLADLKSDIRASTATIQADSARIDRLETHVYRGSPP